MKHLMKRGLALLLSGAMCLSLTSCGDKDSEASSSVQTLAQELGYGYTSTYQDVETEMSWINSVSTAQGKLYFSGTYYGEDTGDQSLLLYSADPADGAITQIPTPELTFTDTTSEYNYFLLVCQDGSGYWMINNIYTYYEGTVTEETTSEEAGAAAEMDVSADGVVLDAEAGITTEDAATDEAATDEAATDEAANAEAETPRGALTDTVEVITEDAATDEAVTDEAATEDAATDEAVTDEAAAEDSTAEEPVSEEVYEDFYSSDIYVAKKCDMLGNVLMEIDLTEAISGEEYFYPQYAAEDSQGNLYIAGNEAIYYMGSDGSLKGTIPMDSDQQWVNGMTTTADGTVVVNYYSYTDSSSQISVCKLENGVLSDPLEITGVDVDMGISLYPGEGSNLLASDGTYLYILDTATGVATKTLSWLDSDINASNLNGVCATSDGTILVMDTDYNWRNGDQSYELCTLTKTPVEELPQRTYLTVGAVYLDDTIQKAVIDFNRKSDTYRITLIDYGQYNTSDDYTKGAEQLDRDIVSGNCPDIVSLDNGYPEKYISKGVLADLTTLFEQDDSVSLDDLVQGPLNAFTSDGKLYGLPLSFSVETLVGSVKLLGDRTSWTMAEMSEVINGLDEGVMVMDYTYQDSFLNMMLYQNMGSFVDYGSATCSFDSDSFKSLLAVCAQLPTEEEYEALYYSEDDGYVISDDTYSRIQSGDTLFTSVYLYGDSYSLQEFYSVYTEEHGFTAIGYPQESGNGAYLTVSGGVAISATSKNTDGAWEFLKTLLTDDMQSQGYSFPITVSALDSILQEASEPEYYTDENGEQVESYSSTYVGDTEYILSPLTQEQVENFKELVNGASICGSYDEEILNIVSEDAAAYFAGDKTADEVAALIQNRVATYLGENI